jgi:hypothetical protein
MEKRMANKRDIILKILLPIIIGITAGGILFILSAAFIGTWVYSIIVDTKLIGFT